MNKPIGVIDSGIGGLTVVKELTTVFPYENIIYCGDNKNVPYGNKTEEEIYYLSKRMFDFLIKKKVKLIIVACNTISAIVDKYFNNYDIKIVSIIKPTTNNLKNKKINKIGLLATEFTINSKIYDKLLTNTKIVPSISYNLATQIEKNLDTKNIIKKHLNYFKKKNVNYIILGCTHYYIEIDEFIKQNKKIQYINPSKEVVKYLKKIIKPSNNKKTLIKIFTTGDIKTYKVTLAKLKVKTETMIKKHTF